MKNIFFIIFLLLFHSTIFSDESNEKNLFQEYCWGCHHQTAQAFGPSFQSIANKRSSAEIIAQIIDPNSTYISLGYKINSMPAFNDLKNNELESLVTYIYKFKDKK